MFAQGLSGRKSTLKVNDKVIYDAFEYHKSLTSNPGVLYRLDVFNVYKTMKTGESGHKIDVQYPYLRSLLHQILHQPNGAETSGKISYDTG